jgi:hypothetical protein
MKYIIVLTEIMGNNNSIKLDPVKFKARYYQLSLARFNPLLRKKKLITVLLIETKFSELVGDTRIN